MQLRIFTEPQQGADYETLLAVARTAEACGFDAFFRSDHYLKMGSVSGMPGPTDAWVTLAGLARETNNIRLGTTMTAATFRYPGPLAISVATVDRMSHGRVELGIGTGWYEREHRAYGIPFPSLGERFDRLEEQLEIITDMWRTPTGDTFSFAGKHYTLVDSPALPKPYSGAIPIIIGGSGRRRTPRLVARFGGEYNAAFRSVEDSSSAFGRVHRAWSDAGRPGNCVMSASQVLCCGRDEAEIARRAEAIGREVPELRTNGLAGTPSEIVDKISRFAAAGCSRIYLQVLDLHDLDHLELVAREVMPQI